MKLVLMTQEEIDNYYFLVEQIEYLYGEVAGDFYSYCYKGQKRWLYACENNFTILGIDGDYILYTSFCLDQNNQLIYAEYDDFYAYLNDRNRMVLSKENEYISHSLQVSKRLQTFEDDGRDGLIVYYQHNENTDEQLFISYKCMYQENGKIYPSSFCYSFSIQFEHKGKVTHYIQFMIDSRYFSFDLITIREFGLLDFMKKGAVALQKGTSIKRYFKTIQQLEDGTCVTLWGIAKPYLLDEIKSIIESKGFSFEVPEYVLNYYNYVYLEREEIDCLVSEIQNMNLFIKNQNIIELKKIKENGSNEDN